ncbi:MAG: hypothetical protein ACJ8FY_19525 [Gemmataceae bacterium]
MNYERICIWLGLPTGVWPPDHYRLLGISPGTGDAAQIEKHVFERMETVRRYQLQDPELATEAMNRLAQAFVCLTNPEAKKTYDAQMHVPPPRRRVSSASAVAMPALPDDPQLKEISDVPAGDTADPLAWMYGGDSPSSEVPVAEPVGASEEPPKVTPETPTTIIEALDTLTELTSLPPKNGSAGETPASAFTQIDQEATAPPDPIVEAARSSEAATRGLSTKRGLYHRVAKTRQLIRAWDEAGAYLGNPARRLNKPVEATELIFLLGQIRTLLRGFPPLLGKAGQPGYLVVALAKQQVIVPTYQTLLPSQRESLARDWESGQKLLQAHRDFLRLELRIMRRRSLPARMVRVVRHVVAAYPGMVLLVLGLLIFGMTLWRVVYLGAMTANSGHASFPKKIEEAISSHAFRPETPKRTPPPLDEEKKPSPALEPKKPDEPKEPDVAKVAEPSAPKEESTASIPEPENDDQFRTLIKPFWGGDKKSRFYGIRGLAFISDKDSNPQFFSSNSSWLTLWQVPEDFSRPTNAEKEFAEEKRVNVLAGYAKTGHIAVGCEDGTVLLCEKDKGPEEAASLDKMKHGGKVNCLGFSPLGSWLASAGQDGVINLYGLKRANHDHFKALKNPFAEVKSLAFLEDAQRVWLVSGHADGTLCLWDRQSEKPTRTVPGAHEGSVVCLVSSPDGNFIASGGHDGAVKLWHLKKVFGIATGLENGSKPIMAPNADKPVNCLAFSVDGRYLFAAFGNRSKSFEISDIKTGQQALAQESYDDVTSAAFSPDGKGLLLGHGDGSMIYYGLPKHLSAKANPAK